MLLYDVCGWDDGFDCVFFGVLGVVCIGVVGILDVLCVVVMVWMLIDVVFGLLVVLV